MIYILADLHYLELVDLPLSDEFVDTFDELAVELAEELHVDRDLLDNLVAERCITMEHMKTIESEAGCSMYKLVDKLVKILRMRSVGCFKKFVNVIFHESHVVEIFNSKRGIDICFCCSNHIFNVRLFVQPHQ